MAPLTGCNEFRQVHRLSRRGLLSIGGAAGLGLALPDFLRLQAVGAASSNTFGAARAVIFLFLHGGHPQHETWDPKPGAPQEVRGEFSPISTAVPGLQICELLPRCAQLADRLTIVRTMAHANTNHVQACLPAMTGHKHPPTVRSRGDFPPSPNDFPHFGAELDRFRQDQVQQRLEARFLWSSLSTVVDSHHSDSLGNTSCDSDEAASCYNPNRKF